MNQTFEFIVQPLSKTLRIHLRTRISLITFSITIVEDLYNFQIKNKDFEIGVEDFPYKNQTYRIVFLKGSCILYQHLGNAINQEKTVPVLLKITIPVEYPNPAPTVILLPPNAGMKIFPKSYLDGNNVKIPYLTSWDASKSPQPDLVFMSYGRMS